VTLAYLKGKDAESEEAQVPFSMSVYEKSRPRRRDADENSASATRSPLGFGSAPLNSLSLALDSKLLLLCVAGLWTERT
jgi:hypothetical protein